MSGHTDYVYLIYSNEIDNWQLYGCCFSLLDAESTICNSELKKSNHVVVDEFEPGKLKLPSFAFGSGRRHWYYDTDKQQLILQEDLF